MPRFELDVVRSLPPDGVREALLDFSERRPELWPGIETSPYEAYSVGETSAEALEKTLRRLDVAAKRRAPSRAIEGRKRRSLATALWAMSSL